MNYLALRDHYQKVFHEYGDTPRGMDWPNEKDALTRHRVMLDLIPEGEHKNASLLDVGCGTGQFHQYIIDQGNKSRNNISYSGLDISPDHLDAAKRKFPETPFYECDLLQAPDTIPSYDYIVMNGLFTEKLCLSHAEMWQFFCAMLKAAFAKTWLGLAFNIMSKDVDWKRDDLFHVALSDLSAFLCSNVTRNFVVRNDYGLYEYTTYLYRQ